MAIPRFVSYKMYASTCIYVRVALWSYHCACHGEFGSAGMALVKFFARPEIKLWPSKEEDEDLRSWLEYKGLKKKKPEIIRAQGPWRKEPDAVVIEEGQSPWIIPKPDPRERNRPRSMLPENPRK